MKVTIEIEHLGDVVTLIEALDRHKAGALLVAPFSDAGGCGSARLLLGLDALTTMPNHSFKRTTTGVPASAA